MLKPWRTNCCVTCWQCFSLLKILPTYLYRNFHFSPWKQQTSTITLFRWLLNWLSLIKKVLQIFTWTETLRSIYFISKKFCIVTTTVFKSSLNWNFRITASAIFYDSIYSSSINSILKITSLPLWILAIWPSSTTHYVPAYTWQTLTFS